MLTNICTGIRHQDWAAGTFPEFSTTVTIPLLVVSWVPKVLIGESAEALIASMYRQQSLPSHSDCLTQLENSALFLDRENHAPNRSPGRQLLKMTAGLSGRASQYSDYSAWPGAKVCDSNCVSGDREEVARPI